MIQTRRLVCWGLIAAMAGVGSLLASRTAGQGQVQVVREGRAERASGFYAPDRAPLQPTLFQKLPVGSITPRGWLRKQLELDAQGLVGRMPEISDYLKFEGNGWVDPHSDTGWEELAYWLRGYGDLGYVLGDARIMATAQKWINGILADQQPDGWFGPQKLRTSLEGGPDMWPHMPILNALQSYYEFSGDPRVLSFLTRYFRFQNTVPVAVFGRSWGALRYGDNIESVYWLYNRTGEPWLLDLARKMHAHSANYTTDIPTWHNVNLAQGFREPAEYGLLARDPIFLRATERDYNTIMGRYGQFPGGGFAGDENCRPAYRDPRQGFETCGIVEFMHSFELLTWMTGDPLWADRCEELAFNSLPAALTPDHKGTHYITCANSIQLDRQGKQHSQFSNGTFPMQAYEPGIHDYRCCPHNLGMGWPYYAESLWLATADRGLCASLYAASEVRAKVGNGTTVRIAEATDYPFEDTIRLRLSTPQSVRFPLYLRVPRWCVHPALALNGKPIEVKAGPRSYLVLTRAWKPGDTLTLRLPMRVDVRTWKQNKDSVSVDYGPLTFSLDLQEKWSRFGGTDVWPEWEVFPASAWNYGLALDPRAPARSFQVTRRKGPLADQPFTPESAPLRLHVRARQIPGWQADSDGVVGLLEPSPARSDAPLETITLIPMGAARLRIASFPTIGSGAEAHVWQPPAARWPQATASHVYGGDTLDALNDGLEPARSSDESIPRFTWWDHKGTPEWVQYTFPKPTTVSGVAVYWFDDTGKGECRVPLAWNLLYKEGSDWKPVEATMGYGTTRDQYNRVTFRPVTTSALQIVVRLQDGFSGGILEWKVETPSPQAAAEANREARLYDALRANDLTAVKRLLQPKVNLNILYQPALPDVRATAYQAAPFLYWALLFRCRRAILEALVAAGADVNFRFSEPEDVTLLMQAAYQFPAAAVRFLLDHGAKVNAQTRSGRTALMVAVTESDPEMGQRYGAQAAVNAALLIARGARVGVRDNSGRTALMAAAMTSWGSDATLALLLAHGAKVNEADADGATPLLYAAEPANLKAVERLLRQGADVKARDRTGQTALMYALYPHYGKSDLEGVVEALCRAGVEVNARNRQGQTALDYVTGWEERVGEAAPVLARFHAVHGTHRPTRQP